MFNAKAHDSPVRKLGVRGEIDIVAEMQTARHLAKKYKREYAVMQVFDHCPLTRHSSAYLTRLQCANGRRKS